MSNLNDSIKNLSNSAEIEELQKAMALTTDAPDSMQIEYTDDIKSSVFDHAPFYAFLENKGRVKKTDSSRVAFYVENNGAAASYINEDEDVPAANATKYTETIKSMKTIINPVYISMMAEMGNNTIDLLQREIEKGYINVKNQIDYTLLQGAGSASAKDFAGFTNEVKSNVMECGGASTLTEDMIDIVLSQVIDTHGGKVDCIVTSNSIARQLKKLTAPYRRYNDKVDVGLGHRVTVYESLDGTEIPVLIDSNLKGTDTTQHMLFVDSSTIELKQLMPPSLIELPTSKLGYNQVIAEFVTGQNIAEFRNGLIKNIKVNPSS